jgi:hypothetical protein
MLTNLSLIVVFLLTQSVGGFRFHGVRPKVMSRTVLQANENAIIHPSKKL